MPLFFKKTPSSKTATAPKLSKTQLTCAMDSAWGGAALLDTISYNSVDELLSQTGKSRQEIINLCLADDEIEACRCDIESAIIAQPWRIYDDASGDGTSSDDETSNVSPAVINRFYKALRPLMQDFAALAVLAKFNGYALAEYIYKQEADGFWVIDQLLNKDGDLDSYELKKDGSVWFCKNGISTPVNTDIKLLALTSRATPTNPTGEMLLLKAYPMVALRRRGLAYAGQFVARYAQPYVIGKQGDIGALGGGIADFTQRLFGFINGGATGIGGDDDISIHQLQGNGDAFEIIERLCNRRIQKLLLGRVKVSEMTNGSRAANETDDQARIDRMRAYLALMTQALQHAIHAMLAVNAAYGTPINAPSGLWFEYIEELEVDIKRAERDKLYADTGQIAFTKDYLIDMVGLEAHHFHLLGEPPSPAKDAAPISQTSKPPSPAVLTLSADRDPEDQALASMSDPPPPLTQASAASVQSLIGLVDRCTGYDDFAQGFAQLKAGTKNDLAPFIDELAASNAQSFMAGLKDHAPAHKEQQ